MNDYCLNTIKMIITLITFHQTRHYTKLIDRNLLPYEYIMDEVKSLFIRHGRIKKKFHKTNLEI